MELQVDVIHYTALLHSTLHTAGRNTAQSTGVPQCARTHHNTGKMSSKPAAPAAAPVKTLPAFDPLARTAQFNVSIRCVCMGSCSLLML